MADAYRISPDDQTTYGFRQLRAVGPAGAELSTMVYVGMSIVLGILTGTVLADGSWRAILPTSSHDSAQASSSVPGPTVIPVTSVVAQTPPPASLAVALTSPAPAPALKATGAATSSAHQQRSVLVQVAGHKHRKAHGRHRLHAHVKAPVLDNLPPAIKAVKPVETPVLVSTFTIQGDATVFNYDASAGIIETYEGQNFAVDNSASGSSAKTWQDYAGNLHYTCDQTGNCTLAGAGVVVLNAKRAS